MQVIQLALLPRKRNRTNFLNNFLFWEFLFYRQFDQSRGGLWRKIRKKFLWCSWKGIQCHFGPFISKPTPLIDFGCCRARFGWAYKKVLLEVATERMESSMGLSGCCRRRRSPQNPPQHPQADEVELPPLPPQQNHLPGQLAAIPHPQTAPIEVNIDFYF